MERIQVNLLQDKIVIEKPKGQLFLGGISKLDEKLHAGISNEKWIEYNQQQLGGKNTFLDPKEEYIVISGEMEEVISYSDIEYISLSMCSRRQGRYYNRYQIDLDIITKDRTYLFEIFNPRHFNLLIDKFNSHAIECIDMVGVIELYKKYPDYDQLVTYLGTHFNEMAKKYQLEHPRITHYKETLSNNVNLLKDVFNGKEQ